MLTGGGPKHYINRNPCLPAIHEIEWRVSRRGLDTRVVRHAYSMDMVLPVSFTIMNSGGKHLEKSTIATLSQAITLRVVGCVSSNLQTSARRID